MQKRKSAPAERSDYAVSDGNGQGHFQITNPTSRHHCLRRTPIDFVPLNFQISK